MARPHAQAALFAVVLVVAFAALCGSAAAQSSPSPPSPAAAAIDISAIPEACQTSGADLQSSCSDAFAAADAFFSANGVDTSGAAAGSAPAGVTPQLIDAYVKQAPPPSAECCRAAEAFSSARCSCDPAVLSLATQFAGGSQDSYGAIAKGFADACGFPLIYGPTC